MTSGGVRGLLVRGALALAVAAAVAGCDGDDQLPSPEPTSLPGVTYSGAPTPTGNASPSD